MMKIHIWQGVSCMVSVSQAYSQVGFLWYAPLSLDSQGHVRIDNWSLFRFSVLLFDRPGISIRHAAHCTVDSEIFTWLLFRDFFIFELFASSEIRVQAFV